MSLVQSKIYPDAPIYQGGGQRGSFDIEGPTGQLGFGWLLEEVVELNARATGYTLLEAYIWEDRVDQYTSQWHVEILGHASPLLVIFAIIAGVLALLITIKLLGWKVDDIVYPLVKPVQETIQNVAAAAAKPLEEVGKGLGKVGAGIGTGLAIGLPLIAIGAGVAAYAYAKGR